MSDHPPAVTRSTLSRLLARRDVLAGLLFIIVAVFGLWASRNYSIGTAVRMGTGYVPRLLCWVLLGLGVLTSVQGWRAADEEFPFAELRYWRAIVFVPMALLAFALSINQLGVVIATVLLVVVGSFAGRDSRPLEIAIAAVFLALLTVGVFAWGLGLPIPIWPEF